MSVYTLCQQLELSPSAMLPPISAPWLPPNIAIQPAITQPTKGIEETVGAAAAPTLVPTSLPVPFAAPTASIHASLFRAEFISSTCACQTWFLI